MFGIERHASSLAVACGMLYLGRGSYQTSGMRKKSLFPAKKCRLKRLLHREKSAYKAMEQAFPRPAKLLFRGRAVIPANNVLKIAACVG